MGAERGIRAALGMGAGKSVFFMKPGPACLSRSPAGPCSVQPWQEEVLGPARFGVATSIPGQKPRSLHSLRWGLFCGKLFPNFLQISKDSSAYKAEPPPLSHQLEATSVHFFCQH